MSSEEEVVSVYKKIDDFIEQSKVDDYSTGEFISELFLSINQSSAELYKNGLFPSKDDKDLLALERLCSTQDPWQSALSILINVCENKIGVEAIGDKLKFVYSINPLKICIKKILNNTDEIIYIISSMNDVIVSLEFPKDGPKSDLVDNDFLSKIGMKDNLSMTKAYATILNELALNSNNVEIVNCVKFSINLILGEFLMNLPLYYNDQTPIKEPWDLIDDFYKIYKDLDPQIISKILFMDIKDFSTANESSDRQEQVKISLKGSGLLLYLVFNHDNFRSLLPYCFHPNYMLLKLTPIITNIMKVPSYFASQKVLMLFQSLLISIPDYTVEKDFLTHRIPQEFINSIIQFIVMMQSDCLRKLSFQIMKDLYSKLSLKARYTFIHGVYLNTTCPPGLKGWILSLLKDEVLYNLNNNLYSEDFSGDSLKNLMKIVFTFEEIEENIMDNKELVMTAINCFGCLLKFDSENKSGVHDLKQWFTTTFVEPLRKAIEIAINYHQSSTECKELTSMFGNEKQFSRKEINKYKNNVVNTLELMKMSLELFNL